MNTLTTSIVNNLQLQLARLTEQLQVCVFVHIACLFHLSSFLMWKKDLEQLREELEEDEYDQEKSETIRQIQVCCICVFIMI